LCKQEKNGFSMKEEELRSRAILLRELGLNYGEKSLKMNAAVSDFTEELRYTQRLFRRNDRGSRLIKIGLALIAFPDPTITDVLGATLVAAGLIQNKVKRSTLQPEDFYKTLPEVVKQLRSIRKGLIEQ